MIKLAASTASRKPKSREGSFRGASFPGFWLPGGCASSQLDHGLKNYVIWGGSIHGIRIVVVPEELRGTMLTVLFLSLGGTFIWDRVCHFIWAREIFDVMVENVLTTTLKDFIPVAKTIGGVVLVLVILGTGNILSLVGLYYMYKQWYAPSEESTPSGSGPGHDKGQEKETGS